MKLTRVAWLMLGTMLGGFGCGSDESTNTPPPPPIKGTLHIRTMTVLTGPTSENGGPYYMGIKDAIREANANGGIMGYMLEEKTVDHGYVKDRWVAAYNEWKATDPDFDKVIQFFSWGTPDTQEFSKEAETRGVPWISGSYATTLATPLPQTRSVVIPPSTTATDFKADGAPFNFFAGTDYSTQVRIAMEFVKGQNVNAKVAFAYCTGSAFCKEPIPPGKTYATQIGLSLGPDVNPELSDTNEQVDAKVKAWADANPGVQNVWFWVGNSIFTSTYFAKAVKKYLPSAKIIMNMYGMDERTWDLCGADCVGNVYSVQSFAPYGDTRYPGMADMLIVYKKWRATDGEPESKWANMRYTQGYVSFQMFRKGVEKLIADKKELTGRNLKDAYESFRGLSTGGLAPPITFTAQDHRPTNITRIYSMEEHGKLQFAKEESVQLLAEWLGW
jgi:branched-chain amino acid transport system substrate-binding protein